VVVKAEATTIAEAVVVKAEATTIAEAVVVEKDKNYFKEINKIVGNVTTEKNAI